MLFSRLVRSHFSSRIHFHIARNKYLRVAYLYNNHVYLYKHNIFSLSWWWRCLYGGRLLSAGHLLPTHFIRSTDARLFWSVGLVPESRCKNLKRNKQREHLAPCSVTKKEPAFINRYFPLAPQSDFGFSAARCQRPLWRPLEATHL